MLRITGQMTNSVEYFRFLNNLVPNTEIYFVELKNCSIFAFLNGKTFEESSEA